MSDHPNPIIGLIIAVFVLVFLVIRTGCIALIAMLAAACIAGITGGMSIDKTLTVITRALAPPRQHRHRHRPQGSQRWVACLRSPAPPNRSPTASSSSSGSASAGVALAITGYIVSIPIFVDSAFVILYPVAKALQKWQALLLTLGVALAGSLVVTHHTVPPTPARWGCRPVWRGHRRHAADRHGPGHPLRARHRLLRPVARQRSTPSSGAQAAQTPDELQATYEQYLKERRARPCRA